MPLSFSDVAKQLDQLLKQSQKNVVTIPWDDAYRMSNTSRWSQSRTNKIVDAAYDEYGIVVAYGAMGLFVMIDDNFSPI